MRLFAQAKAGTAQHSSSRGTIRLLIAHSLQSVCDEHANRAFFPVRKGGFYDHVKPPGTGSAPIPDDYRACRNTDKSFKFDRLGARLPVILVSPWVEKGTVIGKPEDTSAPGNPPTEYDGTSIIATVKKIFNLPRFLTRRCASVQFYHALMPQFTSSESESGVPQGCLGWHF